MARVIAVCNQKGGVGKTTTAVNLGSYLAAAGRRVLLVDFDPQANASSALGSGTNSSSSVYHGILGSAGYEEIVRPTVLFNYHLIPSAPHLAGALVEIVNEPEREYLLRKFINKLRHNYDYVLIDLPPSMNLLTVNGLIASDEVLIPVQAEYYSLEGIGQLLETIQLIRDNLRHPIRITGALVTMLDKRERLGREVLDNVLAHFPHGVFKTSIPRAVALAEAPSFSKPIMLYRPDSPGAAAYHALADEVIAQEKELTNERDPSAAAASSADFGNFNI